MIELKLPNKVYNLLKLQAEMDFPFKQVGSDIFMLLPDEATQAEIDAVNTIAQNHDVSPTIEQESDQARKDLSDGATTSKRSWALIKAFNDGPETDVKSFLGNGGTSATLNWIDPLDKAYTQWRIIFDALPDTTKVRIMWHTYIHSHTFEFYPEPETPSSEYKAWFNNACAQVIGYITDRAQM